MVGHLLWFLLLGVLNRLFGHAHGIGMEGCANGCAERPGSAGAGHLGASERQPS
jgi:hypothetical protein